jgi:RecJ-like exonuclease
MRTIRFAYEDDDGNETEFTIPARFEICDECRGEGRHTNRNIDGNGITASEWEEDWDDESREAYFRGDYDVDCEECDGSGKVLVPETENLTPKHREDLERYEERQAEWARWDHEDRMTRRAESGYRE